MKINQIERIVIFGGGRMGAAIGRGFAVKGIEKSKIFFTQRNVEKRNQLQKEGFSILTKNDYQQPFTIAIIAVKPKHIQAVISTIPQIVPPNTPIVSVAAVVKLETLQTALPTYPIFRIRPNILVEVAKGNLLLALDSQLHWSETYPTVKALFSIIGTVFEFPEATFGKLTWESSSMPIVFLSKVLEQGLKAHPLEDQERVAELMLCGIENFCAYMRMAQLKEQSVVETSLSLQYKVMTKGGLNDAAFSHLDHTDFWNLLAQAASIYKNKESK